MSAGGSHSEPLTLLFTCVGRRVELLQAFRSAARRLQVPLCLIGADSDPSAPALSCVDEAVIVPRASRSGYIPSLLDTIQRFKAQALIPTTDTDLVVLSRYRDAVQQFGCQSLIAESKVIDTCRDKLLTYDHLKRNHIDTPQTWGPDEAEKLPKKRFPMFIKPRTGSASQWVHKIENELDLGYYLRRVQDPIVQEFVEGVEHTLDVYVGLTGVPRCVVPRARWAVRTGEVCKGVTVKDRYIMDAGRRVVETLGDSFRGLVTLQCIVTPERHVRFIEINPRFGGGAPLGIAAGADYPGWLIQELRGQSPRIEFDGFQHGLSMLRYDWSVFIPLGRDLKPELKPPLGGFPDFL